MEKNNLIIENEKELWHYTNFSTLDGIIRKREIWFGSTDNVNDKKELSDFIDKLKDAVLSEVKTEKKEKAEDVFKEIEEKIKGKCSYIFCLSCACDDAAQWERYASGGQGVAIVFNKKALEKVFTDNEYIVDKEFYNYDAKEHEMKKYLLDYIEDNNLNEFSSFDGLIENLRLCALIHKHPSFSAEQEVRISPLLINEEDEHIEYKVLNIIKRVYIAKIDELCQSTKVEFSDLIEKLVVGPKSVQNLKDLKWYLKKIGLPELKDKVEKSECPLR
ncbi:DUF2971 domain-containing protein [Dorea longicatena]|uniref:DUF2971 domain-containing protein n=1 Tax=Dorea longicatena TaxID=88431 RepID=UPI00156DC4D3|nr:DUF2971 domain-containing protein [Dorea longicatena]NSD66409.1 DUF2971 domain-containing protein [Dorea longicatena]